MLALTEGMTFNVFGADLVGVQILRMTGGILQGLVGLYVLKVSPKFGLMPQKNK
jgi:hypothetical protein